MRSPFAPRLLQSLHHYYELLRPSVLLRYSHPCSFSYLDFSLNIKTPGSHSSLEKPRSDSRHFYAGHHLPNHQALGRFILEKRYASSFDALYYSRRVNSDSALFVFLIHTCRVIPTFPQCSRPSLLMTAA